MCLLAVGGRLALSRAQVLLVALTSCLLNPVGVLDGLA
jgi:hypothetical protein